jgi:uncharacterized Tic20 family protein
LTADPPVAPVPPTYPTPPPLSPLSPEDERTWAMLAHLSVLINLATGVLGPVAALIIYLVYQHRSRYVAYHALQSLILQLITWVGGGLIIAATWIVTGVLMMVLIGVVLIPVACVVTLLPLGAVVYGVIGGVQCSQGQDFKYWLIGDWVRGTLEN